MSGLSMVEAAHRCDRNSRRSRIQSARGGRLPSRTRRSPAQPRSFGASEWPENVRYLKGVHPPTGRGPDSRGGRTRAFAVRVRRVAKRHHGAARLRGANHRRRGTSHVSDVRRAERTTSVRRRGADAAPEHSRTNRHHARIAAEQRRDGDAERIAPTRGIVARTQAIQQMAASARTPTEQLLVLKALREQVAASRPRPS